MSTVTPDTTEEVFVSEADLAVLFAEAAQLYRERCGAWFALQGYRRVVLLLAEHPTRHMFWLVAPEGEGRFLSMMGWTEEADALIDLDDHDWPERVPWRILARQPFALEESTP